MYLPVANYIYWWWLAFFFQAEDESEKEKKKSFIVVVAEGCLLRVYVMHYCHGMTMEKLTAEPTKPP